MTLPTQPTASKLSAYLSHLNPIPTFPSYSGPHKVGTVDVEIPVAELDSPSPPPNNAKDIHTVQFRIYYPTTPDANGSRISWLPAPQRNHVAAYTQFLGLQPLLADIVSFLPRHLHYTSIPVHKNANLLEPSTPEGRWPTVIFSHGLGGNRNTYSFFAGSLASHGVVVICPEHRDGSAVAAFVRIPEAQDRYFIRSTRRVVPYNRIAHDVKPEIYEAREEQLRIRLWELGLVHAAVLAIDDRRHPLSNLNKSTPTLSHLADRLHVHEPGSIIFAGHSFGAASIVQFLKSTYYAGSAALDAMDRPLFTPRRDSDLCNQVTERNVTMLLDMWCFPLLAPNSAPLFDLPLPAYADVPTAPGGRALLAVESDAFFKWTEHLHVTARVLSPNPSAQVITADLYQRPSGVRHPEPNFFYVKESAHLSQSDFGLLFPWFTRRIFNSVEPERALRLNLRAQLQLLRANGVPVARTWVGDLIDGVGCDKDDVAMAEGGDRGANGEGGRGGGADDGILDDPAILDRSGSGKIDCWHWIDSIGMGNPDKADATAGKNIGKDIAAVEDSAKDMEAEVEPPTVDPSTAAPSLSGTVAT
ncbi:hypothetical protein ACRALDRAFT_1073739 [Sodiomyces alcalophilus JCM 7366]|uniref:uncharacterized protein n=1 Tax=Sodiomyces alcalophilus JCM 7366 TaxID=591952 RepID=UPI0039B6A21D